MADDRFKLEHAPLPAYLSYDIPRPLLIIVHPDSAPKEYRHCDLLVLPPLAGVIAPINKQAPEIRFYKLDERIIRVVDPARLCYNRPHTFYNHPIEIAIETVMASIVEEHELTYHVACNSYDMKIVAQHDPITVSARQFVRNWVNTVCPKLTPEQKVLVDRFIG